MRVGAYLLVSAVAVSACTKILGIDGRYVLEQDMGETGGVSTFGSGGTFDASSGTGGERVSTGGTGGMTGAGGLGAGGIVAMGGASPMSGGFGGTLATGGASTGGVATGGAPVDAQVPCGQGTKRCKGQCVMPDPSVGCGLAGCDQCMTPPPADGYLVCGGDQCDFACQGGFTRDVTNGTCDPPATGTGGGGGSGGLGGIGSPCTKITVGKSDECRNCGPFPGCCNVTKHCGCLYAVACI